MNNYPILLFLLEPGSYLSKTIHLVPAGSEPADTGITIFCRKSPYLENGELDPEVRSLIQQISLEEQVRSGMLVCAVYGPNDCEYLTPEGVPLPSTEPPTLSQNPFGNVRKTSHEGDHPETGLSDRDIFLSLLRSQLRNQTVH
jgi:hypothetical protein